MAYFDTHCHLNLNEFDLTLDQVIRHANKNGVENIIIPGIDIESSEKAIKIADSYPNIYVSIGIHPNHGLKWNDQSYRQLATLSNHPKVIGIGEIGIDKHWNDCPYEIQVSILKDQLNLAKEKQLPVILHSRETMNDLLDIINSWEKISPQERPNGVFHAFEGSLNDAKRAVEMGFLIGIGGPVTFKNAKQKHELAKEMPLESILLETDAPFLSPHPHRAKKNEPAFLPLIADKIAELKSIPVKTVAESTTANAKFLFFWSIN